MRRLLPILLVGMLLPACGHEERMCTLIGGSDTLTIKVDPAVRARLDTLRVDVRQAGVHRSLALGVRRTSGSPVAAVPGVLQRAGGPFTLVLGGDGAPPVALPGPWSATKRVHLTLEGLTADRMIAYRHREIFAFEVDYPNGRHCGGRSLFHTTHLGTKDALAVPVKAPKQAPYTREMLAPINQRIVAIAARAPGFISLTDDLPRLRVTVRWAGQAPNQLKQYAATWPHGVRVVVVEHAKP